MSPTAERIRQATPDDAEPLAQVHVTTWQTAYRGIFSDRYLDSLDVERRRTWWEQKLASNDGAYVADMDGVVGFCVPGPSNDEGWGEIYAIYVLPDHWGRGIGRDLLDAGESRLAEDGFDKVLLWVLDENSRAREFYERRGWSVGRPIRIEEIGGRQVTEVRYEKSLI